MLVGFEGKTWCEKCGLRLLPVTNQKILSSLDWVRRGGFCIASQGVPFIFLCVSSGKVKKVKDLCFLYQNSSPQSIYNSKNYGMKFFRNKSMHFVFCPNIPVMKTFLSG